MRRRPARRHNPAHPCFGTVPSCPARVSVDAPGDGRTLVLVATGRIDGGNLTLFRRVLDAAAGTEACEELQVDLAGVDVLATGGVTAILAAAGHLRQRGGTLVITSVSSAVERRLSRVRLTDLIDDDGGQRAEQRASPGEGRCTMPKIVALGGPRTPNLVVVEGDVIDPGDGPALHEAICSAVRGRATSVEVDLSGVELFGSIGISALLEAKGEANAAGCALTVVATSPIVRRVLEITGLVEWFGLHER